MTAEPEATIEAVSPATRRALARDDLVQVARDADEAVGIVRQNDAKGRTVHNERGLFSLALERHLEGARDLDGQADQWASRSTFLANAGAIALFSELVENTLDLPVEDRPDPVDLYDRANQEVARTADLPDNDPDRDLFLGRTHTHGKIRSLRMAGRLREAIGLATRDPGYFHGAGANNYRGHFEYELGAGLILAGLAGQVEPGLRESDEFWSSGPGAPWPTGHRSELIRGIAAREAGDAEEAERWLRRASRRLAEHRATARRDDEQPASADAGDVPELLVTLTLAEQLVLGEPDAAAIDEAIELGRTALTIAERTRSRWRVISRSRSPLATAFQRIYGDIALLASTLPGRRAAELGLAVSLSAKQTGFASLMRADRSLMSPTMSGVIDDIVAFEEQLHNPEASARECVSTAEDLVRRRGELENLVSPLLASTVLPKPADLTEVVRLVGDRHALDFVALPDTLTRRTNWFRSLIRPDGDLTFERFTPGAPFAAFFHGRGQTRPWIGQLAHATEWDGPDWHGLACELLPTALLDRLRDATRRAPVELLISPHSLLSMLPWPALTIDEDGARLVERATITQVPVLTCLSGDQPGPVEGPALVRLVSQPEDSIDVTQERDAWGLPDRGAQPVPLTRCHVDPSTQPATMERPLIAVLSEKEAPWRFLHIAAHGGGNGLGQFLLLPERLTAARALGLRWPRSVLMASCQVGRLPNPADAEPFGFVMAAFAGGSRCVVAGIDRVPDKWSGWIASRIVGLVLPGGLRLDQALRQAQIEALDRGAGEHRWALLNAFGR
ncbi:MULTISPECIES: CHAT domain-containing protein [Micromonospora]|nr:MULTISPECIES: CHAT domain-containing protein [unclassified Micromonospora]MBM0226913.1 CHAT domain-containing protein [Micromonospora sp. ATA51]